MRILRLTPAVEKKLFRARQGRDREAERVAAEIIADVRKRGDAALIDYAKKFDSINLRREGIWIGSKEIRAAREKVSTDFVKAITQASRNIRRVAEKQLPQPWSI